MPSAIKGRMAKARTMPNKGMPKTESGGFSDMHNGVGLPRSLNAITDQAHHKRITSDDTRKGFTCLACLEGQHSKCYPWEGQSTCPCTICIGSHNRVDMSRRRYERRIAKNK